MVLRLEKLPHSKKASNELAFSRILQKWTKELCACFCLWYAINKTPLIIVLAYLYIAIWIGECKEYYEDPWIFGDEEEPEAPEEEENESEDSGSGNGETGSGDEVGQLTH